MNINSKGGAVATSPTCRASPPFTRDLRRPNRVKIAYRSLLPVNTLWEIKQVEVQTMRNRPSRMLIKRYLVTTPNTLPTKKTRAK